MSKKSDESPFGGFFVGVGGFGGLVAGVGAASEAGEQLLPVALGGLVVGLIMGWVVEYVLGVLWKLLLVAVTILIVVARMQACAAIREGFQESRLEPLKSEISLVAVPSAYNGSPDWLFTVRQDYAQSVSA